MTEENKLNIKEIIHNYIKDEIKPLQVGVYYPSSLGESCFRKLYFAYTNPKIHSITTQGAFKSGNAVHSFIEEALKSSDKFKIVDSEKDIIIVIPNENRIIIRGRLDAIVADSETGEKCVLEIKSSKNLDYINKPDDSHVAQLHFYLAATNADVGKLVYVNKTNFSDIKEFEIKYDNDLFLMLVDKVRIFDGMLRKGNVPSKVIEDKKWACRYCDYAKECLDYDNKKENEETEAVL